MKYLILLLITTSVYGQDSTGIKHQLEQVASELRQITAEKKILEARIIELENKARALSLELVNLRIGDAVFLISIQEGKYVFEASSGPGLSEISPSVVELIGGEGQRLQVKSANGQLGWVGFTDYDFVDGTDISMLEGIKNKFDDQSLRLIASRWTSFETLKKSKNNQEVQRNSFKSWREELVRSGVQISLDQFTFKVNSADGVEPTVRITNISAKVIKYVNVEARFFNPVGDPAPDRLGDGSNLLKLRLVGPIKDSEFGDYEYDQAVYYNGVAHCAEVHKINVEFMDGSTYTMINDLGKYRRFGNYKVKGECAVR